jgi:hypothetical protein
MKERVNVTDGDTKPGPDLEQFKREPVDPSDDDKLADRREKERERGRRRRGRAKGKPIEDDGIEVDLQTCHFINAFLLNLAGTITGRAVAASAEQYATLDACLAKIAAKYGGWIAAYMVEATYAVTLFAVVTTSPKIESVPTEAAPGAEPTE